MKVSFLDTILGNAATGRKENPHWRLEEEVGVQCQNFYCPSITIFSVVLTNAEISISSISATLSEV